MDFDEFLKVVAPKIGPKNAFDLARDSRFQALENILISKCVIKKEDLNIAMADELKRLAEDIIKMPPPPSN